MLLEREIAARMLLGGVMLGGYGIVESERTRSGCGVAFLSAGCPDT
jgi:hypothetical protein